MATEPLPTQLQGYSPSKAEQEAYQYLFERADTQQLGVLTGELAVPFFARSDLPPLLLGEVWQIADPENSGFLSPDRFGVACRLIGHAQQRRRTGAPEVKAEWVSKPGPLPQFSQHPLPARIQQSAEEALTSASSAPAAPSSPAPPTRQSSLAASGPAGLTNIAPTDKANYARVFAGANGGAVTGLLDGDKAREIWVKSQLPYDVLGQIWNLADTHSRGALDLTDFTIGMHLLHLVLDGSLPQSSLPAVLDPKLYAAAAGLPAPGSTQSQPSAQGPQSPLRQSSLAPAAPTVPAFGVGSGSNTTPAPAAWAITPAELAEANTWFDSLDAQSGRKGQIEGEQAVGFFSQSGLPVHQLAKVWDLADVQNAGHLTRETFAVAMHLLKGALASPGTFLPDTLPTELVPPSMRAQQQQQAPQRPQRDLLDLLDEDDAPPSQTIQPQRTGTLSPQTTGQQHPPPLAPARAMSPQVTGQAQRALSPQATGGSATYTLRGTVFPQATGSGLAPSVASTSGFESNFAPSAASASTQPAPASATAPTPSTFFDDNDDADLAASASTLTAQADSLRREAASLEDATAKAGKTRAELEQQVEASNKEVASLQERISAARAAHEAEVGRVDELRKRLEEGTSLKERAKSDLIRAESDLSALRMEKSELEGEVLRDKEEVRDLKRRVGIVEEEKRILRGEVEKARKEVRQGKGLAAIARKQLAQGESDRGALERDLEEARNPASEPEAAPAPVASFSRDGLDAAAEAALARTATTAAAAHAAAIPLPGTPGAGAASSPAPSARSMNPFDRFVGAGTGSVSPQATGASASSQPVASKNPFAFASSPAAAATESAPGSQGPASSERENQVAEEGQASTSLPIAAAAAVGAGALAAIGAAGAGIAHALGVGSDEKKEQASAGDASESTVEADPFGLPTNPAAADTPALAAAEDGFGDDFAAVSVPATAAAASTAVAADGDDAFDDDFTAGPVAANVVSEQDASGFDDEFAALDDRSASAPSAPAAPDASHTDADDQVPAPVEGTLGDISPNAGFTDAVRDLDQDGLGPDAVQGTLAAVDSDAGFDEAFREVEAEGHAAEGPVDKGKGRAIDDAKEPEEGDVFGESAIVPDSDRGGASVDSDSSDDEDDGPEDAFGTTTKRSGSVDANSSGGESVDASGFATPAGATSTTDLGASVASEIAVVTGESAALPDADLEPTAILAARQGAGSREPTTNSESGESFVHVNVGSAEQFPESQAPVPPSLNPTPSSGSTGRRAAPPPPLRTPQAAAPTPPEVPAFPPAAAVNNGFAVAFVPSSVPAAPPTEPAAARAPVVSTEDDFDSAFADLDTTSSPFPASSSQPITATDPAPKPLFDSFDSQFDSFDAEGAARTASDSAQINSAVGATSDFDDAAFADFDSSFPEPAETHSTAAVQAVPDNGDEDAFATFDDSFAATTPLPAGSASVLSGEAGAPPLGAPIDTTSGDTGAGSTPVYAPPPGSPPPLANALPPVAAAPTTAEPEEDPFAGDTDEVRTIRQMGFSKAQALEALEKYDGDVNRAANSLVG